MKYKNIPSLLHNFTDSFVSLVNCTSEGYTCDILGDFLQRNGGSLVVRWWPDFDCGGGAVPPKLKLMFENYGKWFPQLAKSMRVDPNRVSGILTTFSVEEQRIRAVTTGGDDRGRTFTSQPKFWDLDENYCQSGKKRGEN